MPHCDSMTYIGVYAGQTKDDAEQYLIAKGLLKPTELEVLYGDDIQAMYTYNNFPLQVQCGNYLTGRDWYIGWEVSPSSYKDFDGLIAEYKKITGDDAEVITFEQWN